jgi:hypothetical protein
MIAAFMSGLGSELSKQWVVRLLTPAFAFWAGGLAVIWWDTHAAAVRAHGWASELSSTSGTLRHLPVLAQVIVVVGALALLAASALVAERLTTPVLRLLEGYWYRPRWLRNRLIAYRRWRRARWGSKVDIYVPLQRLGTLTPVEYADMRELQAAARDASRQLSSEEGVRLQQLQDRHAQGLNAEQLAVLARASASLRESPEKNEHGMPTKLGDILRAAELRPNIRYGLDAVACWNALWLVLPVEVRTELAAARTAVDNATRGWLWGALLLVWTPWSLWALAVGLVLPTLMYYGGIMPAARLFGELIVSAFDIHRFKLYDGLHLPRPTTPILEREQDGPRVTEQLLGGLDAPDISYIIPPAANEG